MIAYHPQSKLEPALASFRTHLNYIKCLENLTNNFIISINSLSQKQQNIGDIKRFHQLYELTQKSLKMDFNLATTNKPFTVIIAPWFPVKCYYALYYLESIFVYLLNGNKIGFRHGGHIGIRKQISALVQSKVVSFSFSFSELQYVYDLTSVEKLPSISPGENAQVNFWKELGCINSIFKKLMEYKIYAQKVQNPMQWNLRTKVGKNNKKQFIDKEKLMLLDFFYWYRIKANYRDLDYIDFDAIAITPENLFEYIETYYKAFNNVCSQFQKQVTILLN